MSKRIVYLLGSGATQGAIRKLDDSKSLLTRDIQQYIRVKHETVDANVSDALWNEIIKEDRDVEHIISILDCQYQYTKANAVREYYHEAIVQIVRGLDAQFGPNLYTVLSDLHLNSALKTNEELLCFLSLNYEDLLERSITTHLGRNVDYFVEVGNQTTGAGVPVQVLKLHGSFNWSNKRPIEVADMNDIPFSDALWIPPGIDKKKEHYPFNLLWGKTVELIGECDILRVIGCSLSRNDWGLIPILYTAQTLNAGSSLAIEIIDYAEAAERISKSYTYLSVHGILELEEIQRYYKSNYAGVDYGEFCSYFSESSSAKVNCFEKWLDAKIEDAHCEDGITRSDLIEKSDASYMAAYYNKSL